MTVPLNTPPEASFLAAFEGPAVAAGRMNAKDFGPSLFATASLVEAAAEALYGAKDGVTVEIRADFRRGSFEIALSAVAVIGAQLLQNLSISDLETILRLIGFTVGEQNNLFAVLRRIGGRKIERISRDPTGSGLVSVVVTGDNANIAINGVSQGVPRLLTSEPVREAVPEVVAPVSKPGIEAYRAGAPEQPSLVVRKEDLPALRATPPLRTELTDDTATTALELLAPSFVEGNKWRVAQGGEPFWVEMLDEHFLDSVERGERSFRKGDYLIVEFRTRAYATPDGLQADRDVVRVLDHRTRTRQLPLDFG